MGELIYLGGPIDGHNFEECNEWRKYAITELAKSGIIGLSPLRAKEFLRRHSIISDGIDTHILASDSGITERDKRDIEKSSAVLFNLRGARKVSIGTMIEYGWASAYNKIIITVMEKRDSEIRNVHEHPMVRRLSTYRVETLDEGIDAAKALFSY